MFSSSVREKSRSYPKKGVVDTVIVPQWKWLIYTGDSYWLAHSSEAEDFYLGERVLVVGRDNNKLLISHMPGSLKLSANNSHNN